MNPTPNPNAADADIRHFIYQTFSTHTRPPTTLETAQQFNIQVREAEDAFIRLAQAHNIALAPGATSIWMAHPFSTLPTNCTARSGEKLFWGN